MKYSKYIMHLRNKTNLCLKSIFLNHIYKNLILCKKIRNLFINEIEKNIRILSYILTF